MAISMKFGVLLPHFGKEASPSRLIDGSRMCEELGFESVWVRDHLLWHPHGMEKAGLKFVEPLITLAAIAAVTKKTILGTAVLIPVRWPLKLSQDLASLSYMAGGRVIAGIGLGSTPAELTAAGRSDSVLLRREHAGFHSPCGGVLRRLDRRARADGDFRRSVKISAQPDRAKYRVGEYSHRLHRKGSGKSLGQGQRRGACRQLGREQALGQAAFRALFHYRGSRRAFDRRQPGRLRQRDRKVSAERDRAPRVGPASAI
ncbi:MAG: LLM class flavin-dependent oxidoreductase [Deltaproteobacteria bacterium]|nr:LLM class flavin-dependent oxidoreductase [Deltaproteobacteria bacterium]